MRALGQALPGLSVDVPGIGTVPLWGDLGSYGHSALGLGAGVLLPPWAQLAALAGFAIYQFSEFGNFQAGTDTTDTLGETLGDMLEFSAGLVAGLAIRNAVM